MYLNAKPFDEFTSNFHVNCATTFEYIFRKFNLVCIDII